MGRVARLHHDIKIKKILHITFPFCVNIETFHACHSEKETKLIVIIIKKNNIVMFKLPYNIKAIRLCTDTSYMIFISLASDNYNKVKLTFYHQTDLYDDPVGSSIQTVHCVRVTMI